MLLYEWFRGEGRFKLAWQLVRSYAKPPDLLRDGPVQLRPYMLGFSPAHGLRGYLEPAGAPASKKMQLTVLVPAQDVCLMLCQLILSNTCFGIK